MSRSRRFPSYYLTGSINPKAGKKNTSHSIRRNVNVKILTEGDDFEFVSIQDKNRGNAGSRSADYGWRYFGDGRCVAKNEDDVVKMSRK